MKKIKLALLSGGISGEREVSLVSGEQVYEALDKNKYEIFRYDPKTDLKKFLNDATDNKFDVVLPILHGPFGEDGKLQGMLDMINIPYVFSGCLASATAMNKYKTKVLAEDFGVPVPKDILISKNDKLDFDNFIDSLLLPIVIKPSELGSSVGISIAKTKEELESGIKKAFEFDSYVLLEQFIKGRELTVTMMGSDSPEVLAITEIIPLASDFYDYEAKYADGGSKHVCPADIPNELQNRLHENALKVFKAIGCKDLSRADFMWDDVNDKIYFIEINTIPGMTKVSLAPEAAKAVGIEFSDFLDKLISFNIKK